jgi:hypothetical protein
MGVPFFVSKDWSGEFNFLAEKTLKARCADLLSKFPQKPTCCS